MGKPIYHISCVVYGKNSDTSYTIKRRVHTRREGEEILNAIQEKLRTTDSNGTFYYTFKETSFDERLDLMLHMNEMSSIVTMIVKSEGGESKKVKTGFQVDGTEAKSGITIRDQPFTGAPAVAAITESHEEEL